MFNCFLRGSTLFIIVRSRSTHLILYMHDDNSTAVSHLISITYDLIIVSSAVVFPFVYFIIGSISVVSPILNYMYVTHCILMDGPHNYSNIEDILISSSSARLIIIAQSRLANTFLSRYLLACESMMIWWWLQKRRVQSHAAQIIIPPVEWWSKKLLTATLSDWLWVFFSSFFAEIGAI